LNKSKNRVKEMAGEERLPMNKIICGDALKVLKKFPPESIDMVMTSPPYSSRRGMGPA
jgi:DNA modification methylase